MFFSFSRDSENERFVKLQVVCAYVVINQNTVENSSKTVEVPLATTWSLVDTYRATNN